MDARLTRASVTSWSTLVRAHHDARRGKRGRRAVDAWFHDWEPRLLAVQQRLREGWRFGAYHTFQVRDPKPRDVAAAPFEDRVVHHAVVAHLAPWFERRMVSTSFACREGLGGRAAREALLRACRDPRNRYFAACDVRRYFPSMRHAVLRAKVAPACGDAWSCGLVDALIDSWHTADAPGCGIPIGNLTSQLFANVYLAEVDRFMLRTVRVRGYLRYVDDMVWFGDDAPALHAQVAVLAGCVASLGLALHPAKTRVARVADGVDFAGVVATDRALRLRGLTKRRALRHLAHLRRGLRRGAATEVAYTERVRSFVALLREVGAQEMLAGRGLAV